MLLIAGPFARRDRLEPCEWSRRQDPAQHRALAPLLSRAGLARFADTIRM